MSASTAARLSTERPSAPRETTRARFQAGLKNVGATTPVAPEPFAAVPADRKLPLFDSERAVRVRVNAKHNLNAVARRCVKLNRQRPFVVRGLACGEHDVRLDLRERPHRLRQGRHGDRRRREGGKREKRRQKRRNGFHKQVLYHNVIDCLAHFQWHL